MTAELFALTFRAGWLAAGGMPDCAAYTLALRDAYAAYLRLYPNA